MDSIVKPKYYAQISHKIGQLVNLWDLVILTILFGLFAIFAWGAGQMATPYQLGESITVTLDPSQLPNYAARTVIRMAIALVCSLLFTFIVGTLAAKSKTWEKFILPFIDIMQSVPILGFLSISIMFFIALFKGSLIGPELAAIFAIFTSQVWNMALSFYQSLRSIPKELNDAAKMLNLSAWQRFWRLEVPFATPGLIWNMMVSLSAGWFFVVASEAISVNNQQINLPGIGSYIMLATESKNYSAIGYVILTMFLVILIYDQLIFRPLIVWSEKFKTEPNLELESQGTWFITLLQRAKITKFLIFVWQLIRDFITIPKSPKTSSKTKLIAAPKINIIFKILNNLTQVILSLATIITAAYLFKYIYHQFSITEIIHVIKLGAITSIKVFVLIIFASLIWVPVGVWLGLSPKRAQIAQPIAQFLAAFPVNLVYPVLFMLIVTYNLNIDIWSSLLMILGTQWYLLFNVIAGTSSISYDLKLAAKNYNVTGLLWWRKLIIPTIFPYYVTGAMATAGGCWNASIVADAVTWGGQTLHATGLGGYITQATTNGDFPRIALGIAIMCLYVVIINRLIWHKLYELAENKYQVS